MRVRIYLRLKNLLPMMAQEVVFGFRNFGWRGERTAFVGKEVLLNRELGEVAA